jgi:uncharacterized SAM-binding protein YcdF (DUF218 family)
MAAATGTEPRTTSSARRSAPSGLAPVRRLGRFGGAVLLALAVLAAYYAISVVRVVWAGRDDGPARTDAIVVLGAAQYDGRPSPELAARLDHALALWQREVAGLIVVTGGKLPGDRFTEAQSAATYLRQRGVPDDAIIGEDQGRTTWESLAAVAPLLRERNIQDVVVVSSSYHVLRSRSMLTELGFRTSGAAPADDRIGRGSWVRHVLKEAVGVAAGDLLGYERIETVNP